MNFPNLPESFWFRKDTIVPQPEAVGDLSLFRMSRIFWYSNGRRLDFRKKQNLKTACQI